MKTAQDETLNGKNLLFLLKNDGIGQISCIRRIGDGEAARGEAGTATERPEGKEFLPVGRIKRRLQTYDNDGKGQRQL